MVQRWVLKDGESVPSGRNISHVQNTRPASHSAGGSKNFPYFFLCFIQPTLEGSALRVFAEGEVKGEEGRSRAHTIVLSTGLCLPAGPGWGSWGTGVNMEEG